MRNANFKKSFVAALAISLASMLIAGNAAAGIVVDPKGHDVVQLEQDKLECRNLAGSIEFDMAEDHQKRSVLRGAAVGGGMAAIGGGNGEMRRRSMAAGALVGGLQKNKAKRVDGSVQDAKIKEAQRNCLVGRGYNPIS